MSLQITRVDQDDLIVLQVTGDINAVNAEQLEIPLLEAAVTPSMHVALDLAGVAYVSSAGLRVLMMAAKRLRSRNERLSLQNVQPAVLTVLQMSNFTSFLDVGS